jgi:uncharacterized protein (DUF2384 family)
VADIDGRQRAMNKTSKKKSAKKDSSLIKRSSEDFWKPRTLEQIIAEQNGGRPTRLEDILGKGADLWDSDEEFEEFLAILKTAKASTRN